MNPGQTSIGFFDEQFRRQVGAGELVLNPFEQAALPYLNGGVLDYGCGLGNLSVAAARSGCNVLALDGSHAAIEHLRAVAARESLAIEALEADLRGYRIEGQFDCVVSIGLLMFFDCTTAADQLRHLQEAVKPQGAAVINVLVEGTTYLDMFDASGHCLFARDALRAAFEGWEIVECKFEGYAAPGGTVKSFATVIARKP